MAKGNEKAANLAVTFVGIKEGESAPRFAAYQLDRAGKPAKKLGVYDGKTFTGDLDEASAVAFGPDTEDFKTLPPDSLALYRVSDQIELWRNQGLVFAQGTWQRFRFIFTCVTGTVRKCRPWYWDLIDDIRVKPLYQFAQLARVKPITAELNLRLFPVNCQPLCNGIVEIYARRCCCRIIHVPTLLDRLRDILDVLPIPIPDPIPDPIPGPDPAPFTPRLLKSRARALQSRRTALDFAALPPQELHDDYLALRALSPEAAQAYVVARPYLLAIVCTCTLSKVGQTPIRPDGQFDFCYSTLPHILQPGFCFTTYAYRVKQFINGVWTTVYDGLAANQFFAADSTANIRIFNPNARSCADGPGAPPPNDGQAFVMLEHIGGFGTFHFNFPAQTGVSQMVALDANDGTYTTGYAPDCPWGGSLGLRLWFSPELEPIVKYYRLKVVRVNDSGAPVGVPQVLDDTVTWDKLVAVPGDVVRVGEVLGPVPVGAEPDLFHVPYWGSPDHQYLSGQFHQVWNTASSFADGKYMLLIEVFDAAGNRIKPNGAAGPGAPQAFQFRRWASATDTDPVPFADAAHVLWVDNTPVGGDIVDLRKNGVANTAECQFMEGTGATTFSIGFRAFHVSGVQDTGGSDSNSFMKSYGISWQRGLNGATGTLGFAPSGGSNHTDVGEDGTAVPSDTETFANMLGSNAKCTFSVTLDVEAKHFTGSGRIQAYDYRETASFALEITP